MNVHLPFALIADLQCFKETHMAPRLTMGAFPTDNITSVVFLSVGMVGWGAREEHACELGKVVTVHGSNDVGFNAISPEALWCVAVAGFMLEKVFPLAFPRTAPAGTARPFFRRSSQLNHHFCSVGIVRATVFGDFFGDNKERYGMQTEEKDVSASIVAFCTCMLNDPAPVSRIISFFIGCWAAVGLDCQVAPGRMLPIVLVLLAAGNQQHDFLEVHGGGFIPCRSDEAIQ